MPSESDLPHSLGQLVYKNAATVRDDPGFHNDVGHLIDDLQSRGDIQIVQQAPAFDARTAMEAYYNAYEERDWEFARALLTRIRLSGKAPRVFNVDQQEKAIWEEIENQGREEEYEMLRMMAKRDKSQHVLEALTVF